MSSWTSCDGSWGAVLHAPRPSRAAELGSQTGQSAVARWAARRRRAAGRPVPLRIRRCERGAGGPYLLRDQRLSDHLAASEGGTALGSCVASIVLHQAHAAHLSRLLCVLGSR